MLMKILDRIENFMETVIEGLFRRTSQSIHPVEIGKKLLKVMESQKRYSIAKTYVPNKYEIYLHPHQLQEFRSLQHTLTEELRGVLQEKAEKENLSFIGRVIIEFLDDPELEPGLIKVNASFLEQHDVPTGEYTHVLSNDNGTVRTQIFKHSGSEQAERQPLLIICDHAGDNAYVLKHERQSIGRSIQCDIVINDQNVSRVHAWVEYHDHQWRIIDNNSTNGTYVNDERIQVCVLQDGDIIRLGTTNCIFQKGDV